MSAWRIGDGPVILACAVAAVLLLCGLVVLVQGISAAWRRRKRRQSPAPADGTLTDSQAHAWDRIERRLRKEGVGRR